MSMKSGLCRHGMYDRYTVFGMYSDNHYDKLIHLNDQCAEPKAGSIMESDESDDVSLTELLRWCQAYDFGSSLDPKVV